MRASGMVPIFSAARDDGRDTAPLIGHGRQAQPRARRDGGAMAATGGRPLMDLRLRGRRALATGSTAGIGFAIAEALAREGACVIVNGRTEARVAGALEKLAPTG